MAFAAENFQPPLPSKTRSNHYLQTPNAQKLLQRAKACRNSKGNKIKQKKNEIAKSKLKQKHRPEVV